MMSWGKLQRGGQVLFVSCLALLYSTFSAYAGGNSNEDRRNQAFERARSFTVENVSADPLADGAVLMQADTVSYDNQNKVVEATGNVEMASGERIIMADQVIFYQNEDRVIAKGNVALLEASGEVFFAEEAELKDQMREGVINSFEALLEDNAHLVGNSITRRGGTVNEVSKGIYTACNVCNEDGSDKTPVWQIKAFKVIQDKEDLKVTYRDVFFEVLGVPVFYTPYFSHADPSVKRKSGFLIPTIGNSDRLGTEYKQPYYFALSPHYDLTVTPLFTSNAGTVLRGEWRQKLRKGSYNLDVSFVNTDEAGTTGNDKFSGHIFGNGRFQLNNTWQYGFDAQLVNDDTYLKRYSITNEQDLETRLFINGIKGRHYASAEGYYFQGLRANDDSGITPWVLPAFQGRYVLETDNWGRVNFDANALVMTRSEGVDSRRLSLGADWEREFKTKNGQIITPFAEVRADIYNHEDRNLGALPTLTDDSSTTTRALPTVGVEWRWPLVKPSGDKNFVIEPIVQLVASSSGGNPDEIINEDSKNVEFDTNNLFMPSRFSGLDRWENGQRLNAGVKVGSYWDNGAEASVMLGRSYRADDDSPYAVGTGLSKPQSDYVGKVTISPTANLALNSRFRVDPDNWQIRQHDMDVRATIRRLSASIIYSKREGDKVSGLGRREDAVLNARYRLTDHVYLTAFNRENLITNNTLQRAIGLRYEDECTIVQLSFKRDFYQDRDIRPSDSVFIDFILKTLN